MNFALIFDTLRHLKPTQVFYQVYYRLKHNRFSEKNITFSNPSLLYIHWIKKNQCCFNHSEFCFLNQRQDFHGWNMSKYGNLWAYNLNYMDWLNQENSNYEFGAFWIDNFICEIKQNKIGLDPYPTALRCINWVKFIVSNLDSIPADKLHLWNSYLYSQCKLLYNRLEYHLLGNHLLEDAFSLYISSLYFKDYAFYKKSTKILKAELKEQILGDGAHFEQSPMYHCIILDRLLDCYNFTISNPIFENQAQITNLLQYCSIKMLGHLEAIIYSDGSIPLLNDSAYNIAPTSSELFNYAENLELIWNTIPLNECGYRRFNHQQFEGIIDIGHITASYQPGHSHADSFNYELRINGQPFIIDTGISTYEKNQRRQYERSTAAHNTVSINRQNSSQVWSGFRVGKRSSVNILIDSKNHYMLYRSASW